MLPEQFRIGIRFPVKHQRSIRQFIDRIHPVFHQGDHILQGRTVFQLHPHTFELWTDKRFQSGIIGLPDIVIVQPVQFFRIELRSRRRQMVEIEPFAKLFHRKNFIVTVTPAETGQIIQHRFRQITGSRIFHHGNRTMPFGQLFTVITQNHRQMGIFRNRCFKCLQNIDLARSIVDMIVPPDDMGNPHIPVIHHHTEIVSRRSIRTGDNQIIKLAVGNRDLSLDTVIPGHHPFYRIFEADDRIDANRHRWQSLARFRPPGSVITRAFACRFLAFAHGVQFLGRTITVISCPLFQHLVNDFTVTVHPLHLVKRTFIMFQIQPFHSIKNGLHRFGGGTFEIGILDTQYEFATVMTGISP